MLMDLRRRGERRKHRKRPLEHSPGSLGVAGRVVSVRLRLVLHPWVPRPAGLSTPARKPARHAGPGGVSRVSNRFDLTGWCDR